jgi:hypothetical protein
VAKQSGLKEKKIYLLTNKKKGRKEWFFCQATQLKRKKRGGKSPKNKHWQIDDRPRGHQRAHGQAGIRQKIKQSPSRLVV